MKKKSLNMKTLELSLPKNLAIGVSDARFRVKDDEGMIGELQVSKGSLVWFPRDAKKGYRVGWRKFGEWITERGMHSESRDSRIGRTCGENVAEFPKTCSRPSPPDFT